MPSPLATDASVESIVARCRALEKRAHVTLDDALNKTTQEVAEMVGAALSNDAEEIRKEAGDALLNVLSASAGALGSTNGFDFMPANSDERPESPATLLLRLGAWNSKIQSLRGRYSRSKASVEEVRSAACDLVSAILSFVGPSADPSAMLAETLEKFESRVEAYLPNLDLRDYVAEYPDFPKPGILFKDVSPMLASAEAMNVAAHEIALRCGDAEVIVGLDARGFLFGMAAAKILGKPFVMVRKKGKLPGETISKEYGLEYGKDVIEIQKYAKIAGKKVAIVDDLLATGGTALAAAELVEKAWGTVESVVCAISLDDLAELPGRKELEARYAVKSVLSYS